MKVLFAVNNENISESIIKKYQQEYKQIISAKNVYYFNAIIKELQKDKTYDRIVISEDLEMFSNKNNYEVIDKFIFERLDNISDEAASASGLDIPIILICSDRRVKSESLLVKLFGIGIYNALLGKDRSITNVCELINKPRTKKEAKLYYKIEADDVDYKAETEGEVSEVEIQNILAYYKRLGKNEDKYVEGFENIAVQYTDAQLRVIAKFLPLNVKAVLEANSPKYQEIITFGAVKAKNVKKAREEARKSNITEKSIGNAELTKPIVIPSNVNMHKVNGMDENEEDTIMEKENKFENVTEKIVEPIIEAEPKRRGRPKKVVEQPLEEVKTEPKRRGRPKKVQEPVVTNQTNQLSQDHDVVNLFELGDDEPEQTNVRNNEQYEQNMVLPGLDDIEEETIPEYNTVNNNDNEFYQNQNNYVENNYNNINNRNDLENINYNNQELSSLLSKDKKVVAFVGTSKNGTSFLVNNLAEMISKKGINTAILDLTQNKNAYYIYTENEEELRKKAFASFDNLRRGNAEGIQVNKNLTVYTALPGPNESIGDYKHILETLVKNYSLVIMDCDFETNLGYFKEAQELYLVQSMDILTIQPLTAFLRNLKAKNILEQDKIRIVLNKMLKVRSITERTIIGGISFYNDPAMSFMTELFNKDTVKYCTIPFEDQTYSKYLEGLVNCKISLNGYSKNLLTALTKLSNIVYPLMENNNSNTNYNNYYGNNNIPTNKFSATMNNTLNKMKGNY